MVKVAWIHVAPVKGLAIEERDRIELTRSGVEDDRRFCVVGEDGRLLNGKRVGGILTTIGARFDPATERLELVIANEPVVGGVIELAEPVVVSVYGNASRGRVVTGPWAAALSRHLRRAVRLVRFDEAGTGVDRADDAAGATLLSRASLDRLAAEADVGPVDPRRFRMLIGIDGAVAHEEDGWIGKRVRVGDAVVAPAGNVGRCVTTTLDPDSGRSDLDTLAVLARYRGEAPTSEPLPFGIWARVEREGRVALGDDIEVLEDRA